MLQRSTHEAAVDVPAIPATVQPGEIVDWPVPISGFELVSAVEAEGVPVGDTPAKAARKQSAPKAAPVGEEPQP